MTEQMPHELAKLLDSWASAPGTHPLLGDWRRVGYRRGAALPSDLGPETPAGDLGIVPDVDREQSGVIQQALDDIGANGGGVLRLDAGRYVLDNPVFMRHSHLVLAGAGRNQTTLHFPRPLAESIRPTYDWSWTGGQVYFAHPGRLATTTTRSHLSDPTGERWLTGDTLATVAPTPRGAVVLMVDDSSMLTAGEMVLLEVRDTPAPVNRLMREMAGNVPGSAAFPWAETNLDGAVWTLPVKVTNVPTPRTVEIEQALRITLHPETTALLRSLGPTVHDSGVEGLTIENRLIPQTIHNTNPGSNGVCFQAVYDCWARDVAVVNADVAFSMTSAKSCTLQDISYRGRALHHFTISRGCTHDCLIEDFELAEFEVPVAEGAYFHGICAETLSSGNVWRRGNLHTGTFDTHRGLPFENLRTAITVVKNDGVPGGAFDAGPQFGARSVHWGIKVATDNPMCMEITDVAPRSLTAGITGLSEPGSMLRRVPSNSHFEGELESERMAFGVDLGEYSDLLDLQRQILPL